VHCWKSVNSVRVPVGAAPWHVARHDWSFARHDVATHAATLMHAGSLGQLVGPEQHAAAMQLAHDEPGVVKIWLAPVHVPASVTKTTPPSKTPPSRGGDVPPPATGPVHLAPSVGLHVPSCGGFGLVDDEQARRAPRAPARSGSAMRARVLLGAAAVKDERKDAEGMASRCSWAVVVGTVKVSAGQCARERTALLYGALRTAAHTSRVIGRAAACLLLSHPCSISSN
jgi:hypothetical protein